MNRISKLVFAAACSLPILSIAQTGGSMAPPAKIQPADQPSSDLQKQKQQQTGNATQYGQQGSADSTQTSTTDSSTTKTKHAAKAKKSTSTPSTNSPNSAPEN